MRKATIFILGFGLGALVCVTLAFLLGMALSQFSIQLYESELDQQRNFNFFVIASLVFGLMSGFFSIKRFCR